MQITNAFPSNYLRAADLQGREPTVTIDYVKMEDIGGDHKPVVYFQGKERGLVLNKTNAQNIAGIYGDETDNWNGCSVTLFSAWVDFQGRSVEAIRVKPPKNGQHPQQQANAAQAPHDSPPGHGVDIDDPIPF